MLLLHFWVGILRFYVFLDDRFRNKTVKIFELFKRLMILWSLVLQNFCNIYCGYQTLCFLKIELCTSNFGKVLMGVML